MPPLDDERLAELLRMLPPAPAGWVEVARELPRTRRELREGPAWPLERPGERHAWETRELASAGADVEAHMHTTGPDPQPASETDGDQAEGDTPQR